MPHSPAVGRAARFAGVAAAYFLASLVGVAFVVQPEQLAVFWPAGGLLLGYLLVQDRRRWTDTTLAVFVGNLAANLVFGHSLVVAGGFAAVNAVEPLAIAWAIGRFRDGPFRLHRIADVFWLFAVPFAVCAGTAAVGAGVVTVGLGVPSYWAVWKVWWVADALGAILFAPLVLTWATPGRGRPWDRARAAEIGGMFVLLAAVVWGVFVSDLHARYALLALPYPVYPLLLWVALRADLRGISVAVTGTALIASWGTLLGRGPVGDLPVSVADRVLITQGFAATVALSSLVLAAALRERRAAEAALCDSEKRFRAIFHSQFQFIGLLSPAGVLLDANRGALAAAGVPPEAVLGKSFWDTPWWAHDAEQQDRLRTAVRRAAAGDRDRFEVSHPSPAGGLIWMDFSLTPFRDDTGRVALLIPEGRDITARKRVEEALRESEARFRTLAGNAPVGIFETDADGNCRYVNARWCELAGLTPEAAGGDGWVAALHPDDRDRVFREWATATSAGEEFVSEYRFRTPDGAVLWLSGRSVAVRDADRVSGYIGTVADITDQKRAVEVSQRLAAIVESSDDAVISKDTDGVILSWNRGASAVFGYTAEEMVGRSMSVLLPPDRPDEENEILARLRRGELVGHFETERVCKDGRRIQIAATISPVRNLAGVVVGASNVARDISARKRAEEAFYESEARFRSAFENAAIGMALVGLDGRWLRVNRSLCAFIGYAEAELLVTDFQTLTHPDDLHADRAYVRQLLAGTLATYQMEKRYFHKDGHLVWVLLAVSLVRDGDGRPLYFVSQIKNITDRKRAEEAIQESEERYRTVVESLAEGIVLQAADGRIIASNERASEILGLSRDQLAGRTSLDPTWHAIHDDGSPFPGEDHPAMVALRTDRPVFNVVMGVRKPSGARTWMTVNAVPIRNPDDSRSRAVVASFHDITESRHLHEVVRASLHEKEVLLKEIHHRVKNNLQIVSTLLDLQSEYTADARAREMFEESRGRVRSMALIHERLYRSTDLARVDFGEYIRQLADDLYRTYKVSDADIRLDLAVDVPPLPLDLAIPCGLLLNELMSNCFKHAFPAAAAGCIRVDLRPAADGTNVLTVADDGAGFPAGTDFRHTHSFGLQLVNTLVEQLDGEIALTAAAGTTLTVRFPTAKGSPPDRTPAP